MFDMELMLLEFIIKCSQTCNMDRAEELLREMEEEGITAPISIYHTMMDGYTITRNEEKCLLIFDRLKVRMCLKLLRVDVKSCISDL